MNENNKIFVSLFQKKITNGYLVSYGYSVFHVPIHSYQSVINSFRKTLQAGSSKPWPETLEEMTGSRKMDASAMLEYFKPLNDWLDQVPILWNSLLEARKLTGDNLKVVWVEFSIISWAVLMLF